MGHISDTIKLLCQQFVWKYYLLLIIPTLIVYEIGNGLVFLVFFIACCVFGRSAKLGGLIGWFIISLTIFLFFISPEPSHFIELLLRAPATAHSNSISSDQVNDFIPMTLKSKILWALVFGLRGGMITGFGLGLFGRVVWGYHPRMCK